MENSVIGIDVGYGYVKAFTKTMHVERKVIFPSHVVEFNNESGFESFDYVVVNNKNYLAGHEVTQAGFDPVETVTPDFVGSDYYSALIVRALSGFEGINANGIILVTGLPPAMFSQTNISNLKKKLINQFTAIKGGKKVDVVIKDVLFVPQGVGGYIAELSENPEVVRKKAVAVFDIGYHTFDVVIIKEQKYAYHESGSSFLGIKVLYDEIKSQVMRQYGLDVSDTVVDTIIQNCLPMSGIGIFTHFGKEYSVSIKEPFESYLQRVRNYLMAYETKIKTTIETCLVCGGGIKVLHLYCSQSGMEKGLQIPVKVIKDPQMANARGYWYFGIKRIQSS